MIIRAWRGYASLAKADAYSRHLLGAVRPKLGRLPGFRGLYLLSRRLPTEDVDQREAKARRVHDAILLTIDGYLSDGIACNIYLIHESTLKTPGHDAAIIEGITVEGFVDLLIETLEGLVVVDYKTDQTPSDDELDAAMERYRAQGAAYALALERALGTPVARCLFVFARRRRAVEREVDDLPTAIAGVERRVAELS